MAQTADKQIEIRVDNDKLFFIDRYYTSGLFISYKQDLKKSFVFNKTSDNALQLNLVLGNQTYTPSGLSSFNTDDFDRPFAGWLFGRFEVASIQHNKAFVLALETGITGEESLSGKLQTAIHNLFNIDNPTWAEEIAFKWLVNVKANYLSSVVSHQKSAVLYKIDSSIGSKDVFLQNSLNYYFGTFNDLQNSSRLGVIDKANTNEFYGVLGFGYKFVAHNTLIQGSVFKDDELFTANIIHHVLNVTMGGVLKRNAHTFKIIGTFNTKETPLSESHIYGSLIYRKDF